MVYNNGGFTTVLLANACVPKRRGQLHRIILTNIVNNNILRRRILIEKSNRYLPFSWQQWRGVAVWQTYLHIRMSTMVTLFQIRFFHHVKNFQGALLLLVHWYDVIMKRMRLTCKITLVWCTDFSDIVNHNRDSLRCACPECALLREGGIFT